MPTVRTNDVETYYERRGEGPAVESYSVELFADDLAAFLSALEIERPVLCGHSMAGAIAQVCAACGEVRGRGAVAVLCGCGVLRLRCSAVAVLCGCGFSSVPGVASFTRQNTPQSLSEV